MIKYLLTSERLTGELEFRYSPDGSLAYFDNRSEMSQEQIKYLFKMFPFQEDHLERMVKQPGSTMVLARIEQDITFDEFWKAYDYKVGNKPSAKKLWEALTSTERVMIMKYLPKYAAYLAARPRMEKLYAETFLNQRRWENELPK